MTDGATSATLAPCEGFLWVDRDPWSGVFVLCHTVSNERRTCDGFSGVFWST